MGNQPCESTFRQLRSMTTTNSTVINFNMVHKLQKIELQNEIFVASPDYIKFPRLNNKKQRMVVPKILPSNEDIISILEKAKAKASEDLRSLGIIDGDNFKINFQCQVSYVPDGSPTSFDEDDLNDDPENLDEMDHVSEDPVDCNIDDDEDLQRDLQVLSSITGELNLRDYTEAHSKDVGDNDFLDERSIYTVVKDSSEKKKDCAQKYNLLAFNAR